MPAINSTLNETDKTTICISIIVFLKVHSEHCPIYCHILAHEIVYFLSVLSNISHMITIYGEICCGKNDQNYSCVEDFHLLTN